MTKGLVRSNNFADLDNKEQAVVNLGLAQADYAALKGLYTTAGIDFAVIGEIGNSQGNYQAQLDGLTTTFSGVALSGYVNRSGNSSIIGNWTHGGGYISVNNGLPSGYLASTDSLFSLSIESGEAVIVASGLVASGLSYNGVRQSNSTVTQASLRNGFSPLHLIPLQVGGQAYFAQAGESPSFYIAPGRTGHALDLITGTVLGGGAVNCASPAWAVGPDGVLFQPAANAPVIEYDPVTGACLGARIWGVVTNDSKATEAVGGTGWTNQNSIGVSLNSTDVVDPAGGNKASKLTWVATNSQTLMPFTAAADVYSAGVWLRTLTGTANVTLYVFLQASPYTVIGTATVAVTSAWKRLSLTTSTATAAAYNFGIQMTGAGSVYASGSQVNRGAVLGPYVQNNSPTLTASSTADVWTITGADFGRIINQTEGTVYWSGSAALDSGTHFGWAISNTGDFTASWDNSHNFMRQSDAQPVLRTLVGGAPQYEVGFGANWTSSNPIRQAAYAYRQDNFAGIINGTALVSDASGSLPTTTRIELGAAGSSFFLNGYIRELAIFRSRRPNANLQAMTQ